MSSSRRPVPAPAHRDLEVGRIVSIFGSNARRGYWEPPEQLEVFTLFGGVRLDFRDANLYEGVTRVDCVAIFGGIDIIVPEELELDANGTGLFGSFEHRPLKGPRRLLRRRKRHRRELPEDPEAEPSILEVRGFSAFGSVTIQVR